MKFPLSTPIGSAFVFGLTLACLSVVAAVPVLADPPARVGRLGYMEGTVTFHSADQGQWSYAALNYPVTAGLSFWTEPEARDEVQIGSSLLRMDSATEIDVLRLDAQATQIQLEQGTISFRIVNMLPGRTVEVETPHGAVALIQPGTYRIDAGSETAPTVVAALEGTARFIGPHSYLEVQSGEQVAAIGEPVSYSMGEAQTTPFDDWALGRDKRERESQAVRYVSPEVTGYQDLDQYGTWQPSAQYGQVWVPQAIPAGWAPYREGHWAWVDPWGWTWVDDAPWGFAPFHYGRWAQVDGSWAWIPGRPAQQPVYAPALVVFAAGGAFGSNVGWLPLGPGEEYHPTYRASPDYLRGVNAGVPSGGSFAGGPRILGGFANHGAATFVSRGAFTGAQPVRASAVSVPATSLQAQAASTSLAALAPTAAAHGARPATGAGTNAVLPGPSVATQAQDRKEIRHAEPGSLATTGKTEAQPQPAAPAQAARGPAHVGTPAATDAPALAGRAGAEHAGTEHAGAEHAGAEHAPIVEHEKITAPGPSVVTAAARPTVPLRQEQLSRSLVQASTPARAPEHEKPPEPKPAASPAPVRAAAPVTAAHQPGAPVERQAAAEPVPAFSHAELPKSVQSAPLRPTPAGWNRAPTAAPKPPVPAAKPEEKGKEEERK